jgi:Gas vesicle synthesis protein GvpL/GvpF
MSVYVYGITWDTVWLSDVKGLSDSVVFKVSSGSLAALCSHVHEPSLVPGEEDLWTHERVLETAMEQAPVLPARFGTVLVDAEVVAETLDTKSESFSTRLAKLEGKVEVGIRAFRIGASESPPPPTDGRSYMMNKLAEQRRSEADRESAEELWRSVHDSLRVPYDDHRIKLAPSPSVVFSAAYLVDEGCADDFAAAVRDHAVSPDIELFLTGPWPPYNFAEAEEGTG